MINRTKVKNSIYDILDDEPENISAYIESGGADKAREQQSNNTESNIVNVNLQENMENQEKNPANQIIVHTLKDNIVHNYFHHFEMYWDAGDPLSSVILRLPKTNAENTQYWVTYTGEVLIYVGNQIKSEQHDNSENANGAPDTYWNVQGMQPLFKGDIGRIKEYQDTLELHIDSIGKRFKQKIPDEFRQSYINNQNVRDAFQAICEFLGVKYICPPPTTEPEEDEELPEESAETDGTENDVNGKTQQESSLNSAAKKQIEAAQKKAKNKKQNSKTQTNKTNKSQNSSDKAVNSETSDDSGTEESSEDASLSEEEATTDIQNGYGDINFDANGSIVHGSTVIETSPDMEDTLLSLEEHPLDKYLDDTTYVATDVKRFLNGEMFETVHNNVLNYGAITIEPKSAASSEMSDVTGGMPGDSTGENGENGGNNGSGQQSSSGSGQRLTSSRAREKNGWINGQLYQNGKIVLSKEYINSLSPQQASQKYIHGKYTYTSDTLTKLYRRSFGSRVT